MKWYKDQSVEQSAWKGEAAQVLGPQGCSRRGFLIKPLHPVLTKPKYNAELVPVGTAIIENKPQ